MGKTIFLVEDDSAIADIYKMVMKKSHFNVEVFNLGQEVIKTIKNISDANSQAPKPDIILLDLILPDINGMEVLREIRNNNATKDIKVFILTNQNNVELGQDGVKPDKLIVKAHITPTQLVELIKEELK